MSVLGPLKKCSCDGHNLAYHDIGHGEPVVLVHGITTYSFIWRRIVPLLSDRYRVLTLDLLGCGESDKPLDRSYSLSQHTRMLAEFVDTVGLSRFHLVSHDVGGGIGQIFAVRDPDRLLDLTLINSVAYDFWPVQPIVAMRTPIIRQLAMATLDLGAFKLIVRRGMYHQDRLDRELMDLFWAPMKTRQGRKAFLHFARCLDKQDLLDIEDQLQKLTVPVQIIRGDADPYLSAEISERLHREIPSSRLYRVSTAGHFMQEDEPELIATCLRGFFAERAGAKDS